MENYRTIPEFVKAKNYAIIGIIIGIFSGMISEILSLIAHLDYISIIISILGEVFLLLSINIISKYYDNRKPFNYMLISLILSIIGSVIVVLIIIFIMPSIISISSLIIDTFLIIGILMLFLIPSVVFEYLSYDKISELTGIKKFHDAALFILLGFILLIILVGVILLLIGLIFLIQAFLRLPDNAKSNNIEDNYINM